MDTTHRRTMAELRRKFPLRTSHRRIEVTAETDLSSLLDSASGEPLILERDGEVYLLERADHLAYVPDAEAIRKMLAEPAGIFADMDVDAEIEVVNEARREGSRPPDRPYGKLFRLKRADQEDIAYEPDPERVRQVLAETVGSWADLDIDAVIADVYEARRAGSRPPDRS